VRRIGVICVLALVLSAAKYPARTAIYPVPGCVVPPLEGKSLDEATQALRGANCSLGEVIVVRNTTEPSDRVISSRPEAGTRRPAGASVDLSVSLSRTAPGAKCTVPRVKGDRLKHAVIELALNNCSSADPEYEYSNVVPGGDVIDSDPVDGTTHPVGTLVHLIVSLGRDTKNARCRVPYVDGILRGEAEKQIVSNNCTVGRSEYRYSDTVSIDVVISTTPAAGTTHPRGTAVTLVLSRGRHP
jgi:beta-lactam-binding protein with PASTA domain